jgi:hypothetical protein
MIPRLSMVQFIFAACDFVLSPDVKRFPPWLPFDRDDIAAFATVINRGLLLKMLLLTELFVRGRRAGQQ